MVLMMLKVKVKVKVHLHRYLSTVPRTCTHSVFSQFCLKPLTTHSLLLPLYPMSIYPCCLRYAMTLLMLDSLLDPPFCAHVARSSAALLPSCPE